MHKCKLKLVSRLFIHTCITQWLIINNQQVTKCALVLLQISWTYVHYTNHPCTKLLHVYVLYRLWISASRLRQRNSVPPYMYIALPSLVTWPGLELSVSSNFGTIGVTSSCTMTGPLAIAGVEGARAGKCTKCVFHAFRPPPKNMLQWNLFL
jgi:hypothetical protein